MCFSAAVQIYKTWGKRAPKRRINSRPVFSFQIKKNILCSSFRSSIKRYNICCELLTAHIEYSPIFKSPCFSKLFSCAKQKLEAIYCTAWKFRSGNIFKNAFLLAQSWGRGWYFLGTNEWDDTKSSNQFTQKFNTDVLSNLLTSLWCLDIFR